MSYFPFSGQTYYLGSSIGSTDTTILLSSFIEGVTNIPYTMALINSTIVYATIAPKTANSEFISFTGITQNADGTATLTGVTRGLAKKYPFTSDTAYKFPHAGQSTFIISDAPQVFESFSTLANNETITGLKTFPGGGNANAPVSGTVYSPPTNDLEYASKKYVDNVAIAGAPDASTTTKGIVKMSVAPVLATNPIAIGDNDPRLASLTATKNGTATKDISAASDTQTIAHGLGRIPVKVRIVAMLTTGQISPIMSIGSYDGTTNSNLHIETNNVGGLGLGQVDNTYGIFLFPDSNVANTFRRGIITVDATNIIITWTKTGSPTGTAVMMWEVQ